MPSLLRTNMGIPEWTFLAVMVCRAVSLLLFFVFSAFQLSCDFEHKSQGLIFASSMILYVACGIALVAPIEFAIRHSVVLFVTMLGSLVFAVLSRSTAGNRMVVASSLALVLIGPPLVFPIYV